MDWKIVKKEDIRSVVDDNEWQQIRSSFVGTWKHTPVENIKILREYVGDMSDPWKVRRVLNYLTGSAFRIRIIEHDEIDNLREEIQSKWRDKTK